MIISPVDENFCVLNELNELNELFLAVTLLMRQLMNKVLLAPDGPNNSFRMFIRIRSIMMIIYNFFCRHRCCQSSSIPPFINVISVKLSSNMQSPSSYSSYCNEFNYIQHIWSRKCCPNIFKLRYLRICSLRYRSIRSALSCRLINGLYLTQNTNNAIV
ncbi:hypothetical protein DERF_011862 [Dermatophagoides farinae]|uniref:Uncharacterized protein n=1 Tax=Dermatophagoides farinae TaxID=6954 RepID=A0A922HTY4_DERFA|nr:hypothetical protein DERF_011862 [Dermatophagoides farinae]